jgi:hypothetical protein
LAVEPGADCLAGAVDDRVVVVQDGCDIRSGEDRVGGTMITIGVTDLDGILARLAAHAIEHEPVETYTNGVRHVEVPDGNSLSLAEMPAQ